MSYTPQELIISNRSPIDSFARIRFSEPATIIDTKQLFDKLPLIYDDQQVSGSGTTSVHNPNRASSTMTVSASTAGKRVRQTLQRWNYQPGKSQLALMTFVMGTNVSDVIKSVGLFDDDNGVFFRMNGTTAEVVLRSNVTGTPVDTTITQDNWNVDTMDGTGASGITLDFTKAQIFIVDFEWLGVGRIRYGFFVEGLPYYVHNINNANVIDSVYMSTPNLPIRYEIENTGAGASSSFEHICSSVISEGGLEELGIVRSVSRGASVFDAANNTTVQPILSIRLKSGYIGATVEPLSISVLTATTSVEFRYVLIYNPTIGGTDNASWVPVTNSAVEYDISRDSTNTLSGGAEVFEGYASDVISGVTLDIETKLRLGSTIDGTRHEFVLGVQTVDGASEDYLGAITWRELL